LKYDQLDEKDLDQRHNVDIAFINAIETRHVLEMASKCTVDKVFIEEKTRSYTCSPLSKLWTAAPQRDAMKISYADTGAVN
jgi:hypothetical protein